MSRVRWVAAIVMMVGLPATPALAAATIQLHPGQAGPGDSFDIAGQGFEPGDQVHLRWNGNRLGQPAKTDEEGRFRVTRAVPDNAQPGEHTVSARGVPSQATGSATFVVVGAHEPTATTSSDTTPGSDDDTSAATAQDGDTATGEGTPTTGVSGQQAGSGGQQAATTGSGGAANTEGDTATSEAADQTDPEFIAPEDAEPELGRHVAQFSVTPNRGAPGDSLEVEARLSNGAEQVAVWLGSTLVGPAVPVGEDGVLQATGRVPEVAPGTYWMRLMTIDGELLGRVVFEVLEGTGSAAAVAPNRISLGPQSLGVLLGLVAVVGLLVWWMWRKPEEDEEPQGNVAVARRGRARAEPASHAVPGDHDVEEKKRPSPLAGRPRKQSPDAMLPGKPRIDVHPGTEKVRERLLQASRPMGRNL